MTEQDLKQFQEDVAAILKRDYFPESEGYKINTQIVRKNNNIKKYGITISIPGSTVSPTLYADDYAESHTPEAAAEAIYRRYQAHITEAQDLSQNNVNDLFNFEKCKDKLVYRIVNRQKNADIENSCPTIPIAPDLMMVFILQISRDASCLIQNNICDTWGLSGDISKQLFEIADTNTEKLHPASLKSMAEVLREMIPESLWDEMDLMQPGLPPIYVITNTDKVYGASTLLYGNGQLLKDCAKQFYEEYGTDEFFIIPSSIHECLLVPARDDITPENLQAMCMEVNATQVAPDEVLSNNIFAFDSQNGFRQITDVNRDISL